MLTSTFSYSVYVFNLAQGIGGYANLNAENSYSEMVSS